MRRTVVLAKNYIRDVQRCRAGRYKSAVENELEDIVARLAANMPLDEKHRDHALTGAFEGYRDCHVKPDLLLLYSCPDAQTLRLARLGTHSELFK